MMDYPKRCDRKTALKKLNDGVFVFTKDYEDIYKNVTCCENCNAKRWGNYCNICGDKLTDNLKVKIETKVTNYRLKFDRENGHLRAEVQGESGFYERIDYELSFEFFLTRTYWGWIW